MVATPVLFLIFNRPDLTERVFERIREAQPQQLFIAADGPRAGIPGETALCARTRDLVINNIDWPCEVQTLFREKNLGCRKAATEAINWFFTAVEAGIILEDDTLPELCFFTFCAELLNRYAADKRICHISGNNFQLSLIGNYDYYFSKLPHIWGWATWRRAWQKVDMDMLSFDETSEVSYFNDLEIDLFWKNQFARVKKSFVDEWDYQWIYTLFENNGYALQPQYNLVKNIGFDERALRTKTQTDFLANLKTYAMAEIKHPPEFFYEQSADVNFQKTYGWYTPVYENRISGTQALKLLGKITGNRIFGKR